MASTPDNEATPFIGLTGSIAAGKSEALAAFARHGAATLSADAVVHELLGGERMRDLLVGRWGAEVAPQGAVDRDRIGAIVFERPDELAWLESTLHPLVGERIVGWRAGLDPAVPLAVVEIPLLFETGMEPAFDATVAITAPERLRLERAGVRGTSELEARAGRQLPEDEKARRATHVISNDGGIDELDRAIGRLVGELSREAS